MQFTINEKALRYAKAAFAEAKANAILDEFNQDMNLFRQGILHDADLKFFLSPLIDYNEKLDYIQNLPFNNFSKKFLLFVLAEKKISIMPTILAHIMVLIRNERKEVIIEVIAPTTLSDTNIASLAQMLEEALHKKIILKLKVDEKILGGLILKINNKLIDASLQGKINDLRQYVKTVL